ncbi:heterokaryon incompatibility protein-domain-containing protein [Xylariales sp. PMI_506]|nr:heterokaryon incompatibility protein-domain-containing protein [Xylariales sp. PMI_506]
MALYESLLIEHSRQDIRVLHLLNTDDPTSDIHCELVVVSLEAKPSYRALSYVWGDEDSDRSIHINGQCLPVRKNLYDCLWNLRQTGGSLLDKPLWIDAICINQADIAERNRVVMMMGTIYHSAYAVVSWFGSDEELATGMSRMQELARSWALLAEKEGAPDPLVIHTHEKLPILWRDWLRDNHDLWNEKTGLHGMTRFFLSDYWRRVWIVQEMLLANADSHELICGSHSMSSAELSLFINCTLNLFRGERPSELGNAWTNISLSISQECTVLADMQHIRNGSLEPTLMFILYVSSTRHSSDPRDAIYGLLNVISTQTIVPDYNKSVREVYVDWATQTMMEAHSLNLLSFAGASEHSPNRLDLPSWVPNLFNDKQYRFMPWYKNVGVDPGSLNTPTTPSLFQVFPTDALQVKGFSCGTVGEATTLKYRMTEEGEVPDRGGDSTMAYVRFCVDYLVKYNKAGENYKTGIPPLQALIRITMLSRLPPPTEEWDLESTSIHKTAAMFIFWLASQFNTIFQDLAPPGEPMGIAFQLMGLSVDEDFPESYQESVFPGLDVAEIFQWTNFTEFMSLLPDDPMDFLDYMLTWCDKRRMLETQEGYLGYGPTMTEPGDLIHSIEGCESLLILRKVDAGYLLLGECFFLGLSHGGAQLLAAEEGWEVKEIVLV